jgi:hypothetical protein
VKCHQCDRPAFWSYGDKGPALSIHCAEKLQHILNAKFLQNDAMMNHALDQFDFIMPIVPTKGRIPVDSMARAMQRGSVLNNITVTNSNVGVINTGDLAQIDAFISMTGPNVVSLRLRLLHRMLEAREVPRDGPAQLRQRVRPVDEPRDGHAKPQIRIIGVRRAPVGRDPPRDAIMLAPDVAERPLGKDRVLCPRPRFACRSAKSDRLALLYTL